MNWTLRLAQKDDVPALETLIPFSVRTLQAAYYSPAQMEAALGPVFGVDQQLVSDGTYFVVEREGQLIACGGWSRRKSLCGSNQAKTLESDDLLNPNLDAARIRAFFVHPEWARRGIGRAMLAACETAIQDAGFHKAELLATLAGEPLYASFDYRVEERYELPLDKGLRLPVVRMNKDFARGIQTR